MAELNAEITDLFGEVLIDRNEYAARKVRQKLHSVAFTQLHHWIHVFADWVEALPAQEEIERFSMQRRDLFWKGLYEDKVETENSLLFALTHMRHLVINRMQLRGNLNSADPKTICDRSEIIPRLGDRTAIEAYETFARMILKVVQLQVPQHLTKAKRNWDLECYYLVGNIIPLLQDNELISTLEKLIEPAEPNGWLGVRFFRDEMAKNSPNPSG